MPDRQHISLMGCHSISPCLCWPIANVYANCYLRKHLQNDTPSKARESTRNSDNAAVKSDSRGGEYFDGGNSAVRRFRNYSGKPSDARRVRETETRLFCSPLPCGAVRKGNTWLAQFARFRTTSTCGRRAIAGNCSRGFPGSTLLTTSPTSPSRRRRRCTGNAGASLPGFRTGCARGGCMKGARHEPGEPRNIASGVFPVVVGGRDGRPPGKTRTQAHGSVDAPLSLPKRNPRNPVGKNRLVNRCLDTVKTKGKATKWNCGG